MMMLVLVIGTNDSSKNGGEHQRAGKQSGHGSDLLKRVNEKRRVRR
jgi:hypothetical protein